MRPAGPTTSPPRHLPVLRHRWTASDQLSGAGSLWAWTAVTTAPPGYQGPVPYGVGVVELPEGIRVITHLTVSDPAALALGQAMELRVVPLHTDAEGNEVVTYSFAPAGAP